jgi:peroxiredoxin (alkyl hydroperoxide reductase subunit C)
MIGIGQQFPRFSLTGVVSNDIKTGIPALRQRQRSRASGRSCSSGRRTSPSSARPRSPLSASSTRNSPARDAQVYGVSADSEFVHLAWRSSKSELKDLPFPMLADIKRELSRLRSASSTSEAGVAQRATYIIDPQGVIRFVYVTDLNVGRSPEEVLRVLDALQTDELCPCNWQKGDDTLKAA